MKKYITTLFTAFILIILAAPVASAQNAINSQLQKLEKYSDVQAVVSERRNPSSGKIYKVSRVFIFTNANYGKALIKAFENSRSNATSYEYRSSNPLMITATFENKNEVRKYCLIKEGKTWTVTANEVYHKAAPKSSSSVEVKSTNTLNLDGLQYIIDGQSVVDLTGLSQQLAPLYNLTSIGYYDINSSSSSSSSQSRK